MLLSLYFVYLSDKKSNHKEHKGIHKGSQRLKNKIMYNNYQNHLKKIIEEIKEAGLYKNERIIVSPQGAEI